jgi:hypothetical protein
MQITTKNREREARTSAGAHVQHLRHVTLLTALRHAASLQKQRRLDAERLITSAMNRRLGRLCFQWWHRCTSAYQGARLLHSCRGLETCVRAWAAWRRRVEVCVEGRAKVAAVIGLVGIRYAPRGVQGFEVWCLGLWV